MSLHGPTAVGHCGNSSQKHCRHLITRHAHISMETQGEWVRRHARSQRRHRRIHNPTAYSSTVMHSVTAGEQIALTPSPQTANDDDNLFTNERTNERMNEFTTTKRRLPTADCWTSVDCWPQRSLFEHDAASPLRPAPAPCRAPAVSVIVCRCCGCL